MKVLFRFSTERCIKIINQKIYKRQISSLCYNTSFDIVCLLLLLIFVVVVIVVVFKLTFTKNREMIDENLEDTFLIQ